MTNTVVLEGHPTSCLYIVLGEDPTEALMDRFEEWLGDICSRRKWTISSPELIDYIDEDGSGSSTHTYGCALRMYSALPPWGEKLPKEIDRDHFLETKFLVDELSQFSIRENCSFRLQLDTAFVGVIDKGSVDERIEVGLIGEWRKAHGL